MTRMVNWQQTTLNMKQRMPNIKQTILNMKQRMPNMKQKILNMKQMMKQMHLKFQRMGLKKNPTSKDPTLLQQIRQMEKVRICTFIVHVVDILVPHLTTT